MTNENDNWSVPSSVLCPDCGRHCAVIYSHDKYITCRICADLTYQTCCESPRERKFTKVDKLRKKIGGQAGAFNPLPIFKPKHMHNSTWMRIRFQIDRLEEIGMRETAEKWGFSHI